jgi:hypothetical protein
MQTNLIDDINKLTGDEPSSIQDTLGKLSLDELYQLMDMVSTNNVLGVKQMLSAYTQLAVDSTTESIDLAIVCKKPNLYETVLDWLEENSIPHSFRPGNTLIVSCQNKAQADYLVGLVESAGTPKKEVKDVTEDKTMSDKIKVPASKKPRNPMARELTKGQYQPKVTPNKKAKLDKQQTKHKAKGLDEAFSSVGFWVDNTVAYDKVLENFGRTINFDGESLGTDAKTWKCIEESLITDGYKSGTDFGRNNMKKRVKEGVLGMTALPGLRRMMELAGMPADQIDKLGADTDIPVTKQPVPARADQPTTAAINQAMGIPTIAVDDMDDTDDDYALGIVADDDLDGDDIEDVSLDDPSPAGDFAYAVAADDIDGMDDDAGMDMDMGMDDDVPATGSDASPAYMLISDALTSVQSSLPDVKISEYKTLIQRLEELTNQLRQVGQSYLGE